MFLGAGLEVVHHEEIKLEHDVSQWLDKWRCSQAESGSINDLMIKEVGNAQNTS